MNELQACFTNARTQMNAGGALSLRQIRDRLIMPLARSLNGSITSDERMAISGTQVRNSNSSNCVLLVRGNVFDPAKLRGNYHAVRNPDFEPGWVGSDVPKWNNTN